MRREIVHPGPLGPERVVAVPCRADRFEVELAADTPMNDAVAQAFRAHGFDSGFLRLKGAVMDPLRYVMPAGAVDAKHAAWYSETYAPNGQCLIEEASFTVGLRDGAPWFHCHGVWQTPDLGRRAGHLLPLESCLTRPAIAEAWGVSGATFEVGHDPETNFHLFAPVSGGRAGGKGKHAGLIRVCPNVNIDEALRQACNDLALADADIMGVGSLIEARFRDAPDLQSYATEAFIRAGRVSPAECHLEIAIVGINGTIAEGVLTAHNNPVCVTFELLAVSR